MREVLRSIARHRMKAAGITQINKPRRDLKGRWMPSKFAENWRKYASKGV